MSFHWGFAGVKKRQLKTTVCGISSTKQGQNTTTNTDLYWMASTYSMGTWLR